MPAALRWAVLVCGGCWDATGVSATESLLQWCQRSWPWSSSTDPWSSACWQHWVMCWSTCVFPYQKQLTLVWPALIAANNEAASELRTLYLWLASPGAGWLLRCPPTSLSIAMAAIWAPCAIQSPVVSAFQEHIYLGLVYLPQYLTQSLIRHYHRKVLFDLNLGTICWGVTSPCAGVWL